MSSLKSHSLLPRTKWNNLNHGERIDPWKSMSLLQCFSEQRQQKSVAEKPKAK